MTATLPKRQLKLKVFLPAPLNAKLFDILAPTNPLLSRFPPYLTELGRIYVANSFYQLDCILLL